MQNPGMRRMLRDFGRALSDAISESGEASRKLREIRERGYALYLLLDGSTDADAGAELGIEPNRRRLPSSPPERRAQRIEATVPSRKAEREPQFRINGTDLSFLRSIGIDPTRRQRRRRS